jgi:hypothetical protein
MTVSQLVHLNIDLAKIRQKKVKQFIADNDLKTTSCFNRLRPAGYDPLHNATYQEHQKKFLIRQSIEKVWSAYKTISPSEAWNGEMVSFGLQYCSRNNKLQYLQDEYLGMEAGQIVILNLRLLWGALNIAVAHQIAEVNDKERLIKLSYIVGGASEGSQWITMKATKEGHTEVTHHTRYKSKSNFRDKTLYPGLHTKAITEFHKSVKRKAEKG